MRELLAAFDDDVYALSAASRVTATALYQAIKRREGTIRMAQTCLMLARAWSDKLRLDPVDELAFARRLAGLE